jgi:hypothetical protein
MIQCLCGETSFSRSCQRQNSVVELMENYNLHLNVWLETSKVSTLNIPLAKIPECRKHLDCGRPSPDVFDHELRVRHASSFSDRPMNGCVGGEHMGSWPVRQTEGAELHMAGLGLH